MQTFRNNVELIHHLFFPGEAGAAKTQLCFQIMLAVQLPQSLGGLHGGALYMYTEGKPPLQRLKEMASVFHLK